MTGVITADKSGIAWEVSYKRDWDQGLEER